MEIVTFHGELKRDIGTQFPEKLAVSSSKLSKIVQKIKLFRTTSEEESDDNSAKENDVPIAVSRKASCKKMKRKDTTTKRTSRFSKSARIRIQIHGGH